MELIKKIKLSRLTKKEQFIINFLSECSIEKNNFIEKYIHKNVFRDVNNVLAINHETKRIIYNDTLITEICFNFNFNIFNEKQNETISNTTIILNVLKYYFANYKEYQIINRTNFLK